MDSTEGSSGAIFKAALVVAAGFLVLAELVERRALHRENAPVRIVGRMGAAENIEGGLRIAIVGERAAVTGEQHLVAGMGNRGLFEHGGGLGALPGGAQRLAIGQGRIGILGIGAIALAINFHGAARIFGGGCCGRRSRGQRSRHVGHGLAAAEACGQSRRQGSR